MCSAPLHLRQHPRSTYRRFAFAPSSRHLRAPAPVPGSAEPGPTGGSVSPGLVRMKRTVHDRQMMSVLTTYEVGGLPCLGGVTESDGAVTPGRNHPVSRTWNASARWPS